MPAILLMPKKNTTFQSFLPSLCLVKIVTYMCLVKIVTLVVMGNVCLFQAGVIEEIVNDAVDSALDSEDIEDEIEEEVDKVLTAIAGETAAQLPEAVRKERVKLPAQSVGAEVRAISPFSL